MNKRKERKKRKQQLIYEWALIVNEIVRQDKTKDIINSDLEIAFLKFCKDKGIDRPQDKTLRESIVSDTVDFFDVIIKAYNQSGQPIKP